MSEAAPSWLLVPPSSTPGPWLVAPGEHMHEYRLLAPDGTEIARLRATNPLDVRLMHAAPTLFAALSLFMEMAEESAAGSDVPAFRFRAALLAGAKALASAGKLQPGPDNLYY